MSKLDKTARQLMDEGVWELLGTKKYNRAVIHYYAEKKENGTYYVSYMYGIQKKWIPVYGTLKIVCILLKWGMNRVNKGMGDDVFEDLLEEIDEVMKARNHKLTTGHAYMKGTDCTTIECCKEYMEKDVKKKTKGAKKK